ncbi:MAG: hypothetical protein J0M30_06975 [Chitinophagales bacterium]|nr:hypothetical protein [Chitinophagales bacterium]
MRKILFYVLILLSMAGCTKDHGSRVEIYLLSSYSSSTNTSTSPATVVITNPVLENSPLVADKDISFYTQSTYTFTLKKDIQSRIASYGADKAFAVTVDKELVYVGKFQPGYLSYIPFGHATITPLGPNNQELKIDFPMVVGSTDLLLLDKRNDDLLIATLRATGRLR